MNDENLKNEETDVSENTEPIETAEQVEVSETVETAETVEEPVEAAGLVEETAEPTEDEDADGSLTPEEQTAEAPKEGGIYVTDDTEKEPDMKPGMSKKAIIGLAAGITVVAAIVVFIATGVIGGGKYNKYNSMYIDVYGETAGDFAEESGMEYDEFLEYYDLPYDMPKDTNVNAVENMMPLGRYVELFAGGYTLDDLKEQMKWDDSVTEETPLGEALGKTALREYVGEQQFDAFKEYYGLGDEITLDTTYGEIRNTVDKKNKEMYEQQKAMTESASKATEAPEKSEPDNSADADSAEESQTDGSADTAEDSAPDASNE